RSLARRLRRCPRRRLDRRGLVRLRRRLAFLMACHSLPRVGISSCLLGERVRYDGGHRRQSDLLRALEGQVEWVPNCPEAELGLGVPREPIQIESHGGALRLMACDSRRDLTDNMTAWAEQRADR